MSSLAERKLQILMNLEAGNRVNQPPNNNTDKLRQSVTMAAHSTEQQTEAKYGFGFAVPNSSLSTIKKQKNEYLSKENLRNSIASNDKVNEMSIFDEDFVTIKEISNKSCNNEIMKEFSLSSEYYENVLKIANTSFLYQNNQFTIKINNSFAIRIPQIAAASLSSTITNMLLVDPTMSEINININIGRNISKSLDKINQCIVSNECVAIDEDDMIVFAKFGNEIGNNCFTLPIKSFLNNKSASLNEENVVANLLAKQCLAINDIKNEIAFIARNFESMRFNGSFIKFATDIININTVESILNSEDIKLSSEDSLVYFIISICQNNKNDIAFLRLFNSVIFEYCTTQCCEKFISFINEIDFEDNTVKTLISCIGRRFVLPIANIDKQSVAGRYLPQSKTGDTLKREFLNNNVLLEASSKYYNNIDIYNLLKDNDKGYFMSKNIENSYIQASLKNGETFILKSYTIKGFKCDRGIKNWILKGQQVYDGDWITIDSQNDIKINDGEIRVFNVSCNTVLKAVRFIMQGKDTLGGHNLILNRFDLEFEKEPYVESLKDSYSPKDDFAEDFEINTSDDYDNDYFERYETDDIY